MFIPLTSIPPSLRRSVSVGGGEEEEEGVEEAFLQLVGRDRGAVQPCYGPGAVEPG